MGSSVSSLNNLKQNVYLLKLVGHEHVSPNDNQFWQNLLAFSFLNPPRTSADAKLVEDNVITLLSSLLENNCSSNNIGSLAKVFLNRTLQLKSITPEDANYNLYLHQTFNSLYFLRSVTKYLIETLTEDNMMKHFVAKYEDNDKKYEDDGMVVIEQVLNSLVEILVDVQASDLSYNLHVESINTLIILLSMQMYSARPATKSFIYKCIMQKKCSIHALLLTKNLLNNFVNQKPAPRFEGGSIILGIASGLWNVLTLGYGKGGDSDENEAILARQSLLLLLILTNHCTNEMNPYRDALFSCCDSQVETAAGDQVKGFKMEFSKLYATLCVTLNDDQTTLLLYMMLHRNQHFKTFVLSRSADLHQFVLPILKVLYSSPERNSHHIYMALIILLVLSEDNLFNESVHDIMIKNVTWYVDRTISEISLGGLIILVITRTIQFNMSRTRDRFLHTNLCATLANMSNHFKRLNPYVCQRLITLFEKLSKRMNKAILDGQNQTQNHVSLAPTNGTTPSESNDQNSDVESVSSLPQELLHDLSIYEEVLRMILEIINACLASQLVHNPNLVYTLLYKRHVLEPFHSHPSFQDIVMNIETVLTYFSNRVEALDRNLSVEEVYEIIQQSSLQWPSDRLKKFPELRFRYVEDDQPEEFFIPYIWSLVYRSAQIHWNSQNILLFNPHRNVI